MKDVIEERQVLLKETRPLWNSEAESDRKLAAAIDYVIKEAFLKIQVEADFIINRLRGEAGIIERAAGKLPRTKDVLIAQANIMRGYAARIEDSQAPEFNERSVPVIESNIITPPGFPQ